MITDDDFPADGHWPGVLNFNTLAELAGLVPARSGARAARLVGIPDRPSRAPEAVSLAELSGVHADPQARRGIGLRLLDLGGTGETHPDLIPILSQFLVGGGDGVFQAPPRSSPAGCGR